MARLVAARLGDAPLPLSVELFSGLSIVLPLRELGSCFRATTRGHSGKGPDWENGREVVEKGGEEKSGVMVTEKGLIGRGAGAGVQTIYHDCIPAILIKWN